MTEKHPLNVEGKYYVDTTCVHCDLCHEIAPEHFTVGKDGEGFVFKQPSSQGEERNCHSAKSSCPVGAIQDNGNQTS
jgi:ferredoxin